MRISLRDIELYSRCPLLCQREQGGGTTPAVFSPGIFSHQERGSLYHQIIYGAYSHRLLAGKDLEWRFIRKRLSSFYAKPMSRMASNSVEYGKLKDSLEVEIARLINWYKNYYRRDLRSGLPHLEANVQVGNVSIVNILPLYLTKAGRKESCLFWPVVSPDRVDVKGLYNDIYVRASLWLASRYLGAEVTSFEVMYFNGNVLKKEEMNVHKGNDSIGRVIQNIARGIGERIFYPSRGAHCGQCVHKEECVL